MKIYKVITRERLTPTTATGFTAANIPVEAGGTQDPSQTEYVVIQAIGGYIFFTYDGTPATTALGNKLGEDASVEIWGEEAMKDFSCIDNGSSEELECVYMGRA